MAVQQESMLVVADNSGPKSVKCIKVLGGSKRRYAFPGDKIKVAVRSAEPNSNIPKGTVVDAIVVRAKQPERRPDGSYIRSNDNACVIVNDQGQPRGTRIFGYVSRKVREKGYAKILSLAPEGL